MPSALPRRARAARLAARHAARAALVLATLVGAAACGDDDDPTGTGPDVEIESVRLTVTPAGGAATTYTVTANSESAAPIPLRVGANTIVATPIGADGQVADEADEFELRLTGLPTGATAARAGLTNTVTATAAAAATRVEAEMYHVAEGHGDYTAVFRVTVAP